MARAQDQRRWRANTARQRLEVYLPVECVVALDALVVARGASRATVIADLIGNMTAETGEPAPEAVSATEPTGQATTAVLEPVPTATAGTAGGYRFRRPSRADEQRYQWIAEGSDGTRIGLGPDPARFYRWRGMILDGSLYIKEAKGHSRDDVVAQLL